MDGQVHDAALGQAVMSAGTGSAGNRLNLSGTSLQPRLAGTPLAKAKERASKAVANGRLTQQRADALLARLTERIERLVQRVPARR